MEIKFCRRCAAPVTEIAKNDGEYKCANGHSLFYKSYPGTIAVLLNDKNEVLMAVRGRDPGKGTLDLPGGFVGAGETLTEALARELQEETGLAPADYSALQYVESAIDSYDWQGEAQPVLGNIFWAHVTNASAIKANDDVAELMWVPLADVDETKIAPGFAAVKKAISMTRQRLGVKPTNV